MMRSRWLILWPSFVVAGMAEGVFFSLVNPQELYFLGEPVHFSLLATYSIGFLAFWAVCAISSFTTWLLLQPADEINKTHRTRDSHVAMPHA